MKPKYTSGYFPQCLRKQLSPEQCIANAVQLVEGTSRIEGGVERLIQFSPIQVDLPPSEQLAISMDHILCSEFAYNFVAGPDGKFDFPGFLAEAEDFKDPEVLQLVSEIPEMRFRPNPVPKDLKSTVRDSDILHHDYVLIESDLLPVDLQAAVIKKLILSGLNVRSAVHSGSKSIHALVYFGARDAADFRVQKTKLYRRLSVFGFDMSVGNPSRLTRLPGCPRYMKDGTVTLQKLLYLA